MGNRHEQCSPEDDLQPRVAVAVHQITRLRGERVFLLLNCDMHAEGVTIPLAANLICLDRDDKRDTSVWSEVTTLGRADVCMDALRANLSHVMGPYAHSWPLVDIHGIYRDHSAYPDNYMVSVDMKRGTINDPERLVVPQRYLKLLVDFPMERPLVVVVDSKSVRGFTCKMLYVAISDTLVSCFKMEQDRISRDRVSLSRLMERLHHRPLAHHRIVDISFNSSLNCVTTRITI